MCSTAQRVHPGHSPTVTVVGQSEPTDPSSGRRAPADEGPLIGMGALLQKMREEFPDISASKVRFLEDQGLLHPARTPSGYRKFSTADCDRLRQVLILQRERYLPLKVIRELSENGQLEELLQRSVTQSNISPEHPPVTAEPAGGHNAEPLTMRELCHQTGAGIPLVRELMSFGLLHERSGGFGSHDVSIVSAACVLRDHGVEPRHLRALRQAVDREIGFVEQAIAPDVAKRSPQASRRAQQRAEEITRLCLDIHASLLMGRYENIQQKLDAAGGQDMDA